jgi:hypothetical protein
MIAEYEQKHETRAPMLRWADIQSLMLAEDSLCISIYVPTTPGKNYREENRIGYKDQIQKVSESLNRRDMDKYLRDDLIDRLETVGNTEVFWTHQQYGLAAFLSEDRFMVRRMMLAPEPALGIVAESFHLRPALRETANWMRYQVLCVSLHQVALYDCNREHISEVELDNDVPQGMGEAIGKTENSANRKDSKRSGSDPTDLRDYFQAVDKAIRDNHDGNARVPLILAAVEEHQGLFHAVSKHPSLLDTGLEKDPFEEIRQSRLGENTWPIAREAVQSEGDRWVEQYRERQAHREGESALDKVAYSATLGQIARVLIDESARVEGTIDADSGAVIYGTSDDAYTDDVLDSIAEYVLRFDGEVRFIPGDKMPTDTGVAAVLRYAMYPESMQRPR